MMIYVSLFNVPSEAFTIGIHKLHGIASTVVSLVVNATLVVILPFDDKKKKIILTRVCRMSSVWFDPCMKVVLL